jgi:alanyl-tRNA synthetase
VTNRLYLQNSYLTEFDGTILERDQENRTVRLCLDRTLFYPTGGGQPHDTGWLDSVKVLNVTADEYGNVWHHLEHPLPGTPDTVHGIIDWGRRFDFMQQHTAFHILAGALTRHFDIETVASHLGEETSTLDTDQHTISPQQIQKLEDIANDILWQDLPVNGKWVSRAELDALPSRKISDRQDPIRLIDIENWDLDPCGGTHVSGTAQVGLIKIVGRERIRQATRLTFLAGKRALNDFQHNYKTLQELSGQLSTGFADLPESVNKLFVEQKGLLKQIKTLQDFRLGTLVDILTAEAMREGFVVQQFPDLGMADLRVLASRSMKKHPGIYCLYGGQTPVPFVFASPDGDPDMNSVLQALVSVFDARGGGKPAFVQGAGTVLGDMESVINKTIEKLTAVK